MFESLTQRLQSAFGALRGQKELTEENVEEGLEQVRGALLEADVHFQVVKTFTNRVREAVLGQAAVKGVDPSEQFVHACHRELVALMGDAGDQPAGLQMAKTPPTVILMAGLQGAGKTTTCAKLAKLLTEKHGRRPLLVAADVKRPAAVEQLRVLGQRVGVPVFHLEGATAPDVCVAGIAEARRTGRDVVILDTAGRLHVDEAMMAEVRAIAERTRPNDQLLVVDAMTG
jgi:signal recognition particle subunit SRP54